MDSTSACNGRIKRWRTAIYQYGITGFNAAQGVADYKKNGGITSANPARDMFSAYNGMAAGFFNGDWGVLLTALASNNKMTSSPPRAS